jgi:hypothetical protein
MYVGRRHRKVRTANCSLRAATTRFVHSISFSFEITTTGRTSPLTDVPVDSPTAGLPVFTTSADALTGADVSIGAKADALFENVVSIVLLDFVGALFATLLGGRMFAAAIFVPCLLCGLLLPEGVAVREASKVVLGIPEPAAGDDGGVWVSRKRDESENSHAPAATPQMVPNTNGPQDMRSDIA